MRLLPLVLLALLTACAPTSSVAAPKPVLPAQIDALPRAGALESGEVTLRLNASARERLAHAGITLRGSGGVSVNGATVTFDVDPNASARIDPTTMRGEVAVGGTLIVAHGRRTARLRQLTFAPGVARALTAKLGKRTIKLGTLTGGTRRFSRQADGRLTDAKLSLRTSAARALTKALGATVSAGQFGRVTIDATTRELPLASGTATLTLDPAVLHLIESNGYDLQPTAPATRDGNVITIALTAGAFDPLDLTGRLRFDGALHFANAATGKAVDLFGFRAAVGAGQSDLYAQISQAVTPVLGNLDLAQVEAGLDGRTFHATGAKLYFSKIAVSTLKQSFGVTIAAGQPLGSVDLTGTISGTF